MRVMSLLLSIAVTGCSASMPSAQSIQTSWVPCTTSHDAPGLDIVGAIAGGMAALVGIANYVGAGTEGEDSDEEGLVKLGSAGLVVIGGVTALAFGASHRHGSRSADACAARTRPP